MHRLQQHLHVCRHAEETADALSRHSLYTEPFKCSRTSLFFSLFLSHQICRRHSFLGFGDEAVVPLSLGFSESLLQSSLKLRLSSLNISVDKQKLSSEDTGFYVFIYVFSFDSYSECVTQGETVVLGLRQKANVVVALNISSMSD